MALYLTEADVEELITPAEAVPVIEACFRRMAAGAVRNVPRRRLPLEDGSFAVMSAVDLELGYAGVKAYAVAGGRASFAVSLFDAATGEPSPCSRPTPSASAAPAPRRGSRRSTSRAPERERSA